MARDIGDQAVPPCAGVLPDVHCTVFSQQAPLVWPAHLPGPWQKSKAMHDGRRAQWFSHCTAEMLEYAAPSKKSCTDPVPAEQELVNVCQVPRGSGRGGGGGGGGGRGGGGGGLLLRPFATSACPNAALSRDARFLFVFFPAVR